MSTADLRFRAFAHLSEAELRFGDLTLFVGPQASGKSLVAQLWKWVVDAVFVRQMLGEYGYQLTSWEDFAEAYFGEGLGRAAWQAKTRVWRAGKPWPEHEGRLLRTFTTEPERVLYIPAQRVLCLVNEWPRPFRDFAASDPFVLKRFSEIMRQALDTQTPAERLFARAPTTWYTALQQALYPNAEMRLQVKGLRKRIVQRLTAGASPGVDIPLMTWSAGQREFFPLLWAADWLLTAQGRRADYRWVVVEEPEMGLHPLALQAFFLIVAEWLARGYKVLLTTHAAQVLELGWVLQRLRTARAQQPAAAPAVRQALQTYLPVPPPLADTLLAQEVRVYYFKRANGQVTLKDISGLDAWSDDWDEAAWGGLTAPAARAQEAVAQVINGLEAVE